MAVPEEHTELSSEEVRIHIHRKPACRTEMRVHPAPQLVKEARKNALKNVSKEVSLPGFRKGRAPEEMILKKFPTDVEKQFHKALADLAFVAAQKVAHVPVLNNNSPISFDLKKESEEGAELVYSFETEPVIPNIDPTGFTPKPVKRAEVGEKQIDEAVRQMRFFFAQWKPVHERPVQDGDYIMIDLDVLDGENVQRVFHHIRFEVSKERMAGWMKKLVEGATAGAVLDGISEPDETATEAEKEEFKPKKVRLTLLKIEEASLPETDDEFAKKVGAPDVASMRQSIADLLNRQADEKRQSDLGEQVNEFLIDNYHFDLPQSLIDTERNHRLTNLLKDPNFKAKWDHMSQEERKDFENKLHRESEQAVRLFYLSRHIVQNEKIPVTHQEVQNEAVAIYQTHGGGHIDVEKLPKELYAIALSKVILAKAQDYILRHAAPSEDKKT